MKRNFSKRKSELTKNNDSENLQQSFKIVLKFVRGKTGGKGKWGFEKDSIISQTSSAGETFQESSQAINPEEVI